MAFFPLFLPRRAKWPVKIEKRAIEETGKPFSKNRQADAPISSGACFCGHKRRKKTGPRRGFGWFSTWLFL